MIATLPLYTRPNPKQFNCRENLTGKLKEPPRGYNRRYFCRWCKQSDGCLFENNIKREQKCALSPTERYRQDPIHREAQRRRTRQDRYSKKRTCGKCGKPVTNDARWCKRHADRRKLK